MPETTWSDGDVATATLLNQIEDQIIVTCTSSTRPTGAEGRMIYETDTDKLMLYNGTAWKVAGGGGWVSFTPSYTNLTVGNATNNGMYRYVPGGIRFKVQTTFGTTSAMGTNPTLTIPNSETSASDSVRSIGPAVFSDAGTRSYPGTCLCTAGTTTVSFVHTESGNAGAPSATAPFTWTTSDILFAEIMVAL